MERDKSFVEFPQDPDGSAAAMQRLMQLYKQRAESMHTIHAAYNKALAAHRARALAHIKESQRQREKSRVYHVMKMISSMQQRKDVEAKMKDLVLRMHLDVKHVENMMLTGYRGRQMDASKSLATDVQDGAQAGGDL